MQNLLVTRPSFPKLWLIISTQNSILLEECSFLEVLFCWQNTLVSIFTYIFFFAYSLSLKWHLSIYCSLSATKIIYLNIRFDIYLIIFSYQSLYFSYKNLSSFWIFIIFSKWIVARIVHCLGWYPVSIIIERKVM